MASKHRRERNLPMRKATETSGRTDLKTSTRRELVRRPAESVGSSKADRGKQAREGMECLLPVRQSSASPPPFVVTEISFTSVEKPALQGTLKSLVQQSVIVSHL